MQSIQYIGKKAIYKDNLYGTGLVFAPGKIHSVKDGPASKMLQHTDVYRAVEGSEPPTTDVDEHEETDNSKDVDAERPRRVPLPNFMTMDKRGMIEFAREYYGEEIHHATSLENVKSRIVGLINERGRD